MQLIILGREELINPIRARALQFLLKIGGGSTLKILEVNYIEENYQYYNALSYYTCQYNYQILF